MKHLAALATLVCQAQAPTADQLHAEANQAYAKKEFQKAAALYAQAARLDPDTTTFAYNAACSFALAGSKEEAFRWLEEARQHGYFGHEALQSDSDFESLRSDPRWQPLVASVRKAAEAAARLWDSPSLATPYQANLSEDEKIAGLSKFWSEVKWNFWNTDRLAELDWDGLYLKTLPKVRAAPNTAAYYRVLEELCAQLQDGHTGITRPVQARGRLPLFRVQLVEGRVLVRLCLDPDLKAKGVEAGVEVTHVQGEPVQAYVARELAPAISASTPQDRSHRIYDYGFLRGPQAEVLEVTFREAGGRAFTLPVTRPDEARLKSVAFPVQPPFQFAMLPGNVAHVTLNSFGDDTAAKEYLKRFDEISKASAMVFDVRQNGGGNGSVGFQILATLTDRPFLTSRWSTRTYKAAMRAWGRKVPLHRGEAGQVPPDGTRHYKGPVVVLTGGMTYSAAEDFTLAFDGMKRGTILGEPTGGSTGQPLHFKLPGGGSARVCTKLDSFPDGKMFVGVGIQPHHLVRPTLEDVRAGRDTVLEAALKALADTNRTR